jgi:hypothetical protein
MIKVVKNNPFRILGLPATASDKEITKRVAELEVYIKMGKRKKYDLDFPFLGNFKRTSETLQDAVNKLSKPVERIFYSLFWFDNIDEFEFEKLKEKNINEAITIIKNSSDNRKVESIEQFSGYKNLSILYLYKIYNDDKNEEENFYKYFYAFSKFLTSNQLNNYINIILKNKNKINSDLVIKRYLDIVDKILTDYLCIDIEIDRDFIERFIDSLYHYSDDVKVYVTNKYIQLALSKIRNEIEKCSLIRKEKPEEAYESGANLYFNTEEFLIFLKHKYKFLDVRYQTIADKLAEEILECSIAYFNRYNNSDDDIDPCEESLELSEYADSIVVGDRLKEKILKDLKTTQEWVEARNSSYVDPHNTHSKYTANGNGTNTNESVSKQYRKHKQKHIDPLLNTINLLIENLPKSQSETRINILKGYPNIVDNFLFQSRKQLSKLKIELCDNKFLYYDVSNSVVNNAMNLIIHFANHNLDKTNIIYLLDEIAQFDMNGDTEIRFKDNMETILSDYRTYLKSLKQLEVELKKIHKTKRVKTFIWISIITVIVVSILIFSNANKSEDSDYQITTKQTLTDQKINISPSLKKINSNFEKEKKVSTKKKETNLDQQIKKTENSVNFDSNDDYLLTFNGKSYYLTKYHYDKAGELEPPKNEEADLTLKYNELEKIEKKINELGNNLDKFANKIDKIQVDKYSQTSIDNYNALTNRYNADIQIIKNKTSNYNSKLTKYESIRKIYNKKVDIYNSYLIKHGTLRKY